MLRKHRILIGLVSLLVICSPISAHAEWKVPVGGGSGGSQNIGGGGGEVVHLDEVVIIRNPVLYHPKVTYVKSINAALANAGESVYFLPAVEDFPVDLKDTIANQEGHNFAIVYDGDFDKDVKLSSVQPLNKTGVDTAKQDRMLTSKKVYSASKNSKCLNLLGYDLLLMNETPYLSISDGQFKCSMNSIPIDDRTMGISTVVMDLYKAMGVYEWDIQFAYSKPAGTFDINKSPIYQYIGTLTTKDYDGGVDTSELETWVVASRSNRSLYWDRFKKDAIMDGGTHNILDKGTTSLNRSEQNKEQTYESYIFLGNDTSVSFSASGDDDVDTFQFFQLARAIMSLYGEPVLSEEEYNMVQNRFAAYLPDDMTTDEFDATIYMLAKGIVSLSEIDPSAHVTFPMIENWLLRIADEGSRLKFSTDGEEYNMLTENGYTDVNVDIIPDSTMSSMSTSSLHEYDVLIEVNDDTKFIVKNVPDEATNPTKENEGGNGSDDDDNDPDGHTGGTNGTEGQPPKELTINTPIVSADYVTLVLETDDGDRFPIVNSSNTVRPGYEITQTGTDYAYDDEQSTVSLLNKNVRYKGVENYDGKSYYHFVIPQNNQGFRLVYDLHMARLNSCIGIKVDAFDESNLMYYPEETENGDPDSARFITNGLPEYHYKAQNEDDKPLNGRCLGGVYTCKKKVWSHKTFEEAGFSDKFYDYNYYNSYSSEVTIPIEEDDDSDTPAPNVKGTAPSREYQYGLSKDNTLATCCVEVSNKVFTQDNIQAYNKYLRDNTEHDTGEKGAVTKAHIKNSNKFNRNIKDKNDLTITVLYALGGVQAKSSSKTENKLDTSNADGILKRNNIGIRVVQSIVRSDSVRIELVCKATELDRCKMALTYYAKAMGVGTSQDDKEKVFTKGYLSKSSSSGAKGYYRHEDNSMLISYDYLKEMNLVSDLTETDKGIVITSNQRLLNVYLISTDNGASGNIMVGNTFQANMNETLFAEIKDKYYINVRACLGWANDVVSVPCNGADGSQGLITKDFACYISSKPTALGNAFEYSTKNVQLLPQMESIGINTLKIHKLKKGFANRAKKVTRTMIPIGSSYAVSPYMLVLGADNSEEGAVDYLFVMHSKDYVHSNGKDPYEWDSDNGKKILDLSSKAITKYKDLTSFEVKVPDGYVLMCYQLKRDAFKQSGSHNVFNSNNKKTFNLYWYTQKFNDITGKSFVTTGWIFNPTYYKKGDFLKALDEYNNPDNWISGFNSDGNVWTVDKQANIKQILPIFAYYEGKVASAKLYDANVNKCMWVGGNVLPINQWSAKLSSKTEANAEKYVSLNENGKTSYKDLEENLTSANLDIVPAPAGVFFTANEQELVSLSKAAQGQLYYGTCKIKADNSSVTINNFVTSLSPNAQAVRTFVGTSQAVYCALPEKMSASNIQQLLNKAESTLDAAYEDPVGAVDWAAYKFDRMIKNVDGWSTVAWIFILNILPRVGMFLFMILLTLSVIKDVPFWKKFCQSKFDIYRLLTFEHQTVDTIDTRKVLIYSCISLALFMMIMDGNLFNFMIWVSEMFIHLYQN